jgi:hypothetical protein
VPRDATLADLIDFYLALKAAQAWMPMRLINGADGMNHNPMGYLFNDAHERLFEALKSRVVLHRGKVLMYRQASMDFGLVEAVDSESIALRGGE